jgi:hypothetical protein
LKVSQVLREFLVRLMPEAAAEDYADKFAGLPAAIAGSFVLEVPLTGDAEAPPDVSLGITTRLGRDILGKRAGAAVLAEPWKTGLAPATAWARAWTDEPQLAQSFQALWLEMDADGPRMGEPDLVFARGISFPRESEPARTRLSWVFEEYLDRLGHPVPGARDSLYALVDGLPEQAALSYLGIAAGGRTPGLKICIEGQSTSTVAHYLEQLSWGGPREALGRALALLQPHAQGIVLQLALAPELVLKIGLEVYRRAQDFDGLLDALQTEGLVQAHSLARVRGWTRPDQDVPAERLMPGVPAFVLGGRRPYLVSAVSHIKLSVGPEGLEAKAYLWGALRWHEAIGP